MTERTWETNADEFALLAAGEGWPFAVLVACSVNKDFGDKHLPLADRLASPKVSATEFGGRAHTSHTRVLRYLRAWEAAADGGLVPHSDTLEPADAPTATLPSMPWRMFYQPTLRPNREAYRRKAAAASGASVDTADPERQEVTDTPFADDRLGRPERLVARAAQLIVEMHQVEPLTYDEERRVQQMALRLLESVDKGATPAAEAIREAFKPTEPEPEPEQVQQLADMPGGD